MNHGRSIIVISFAAFCTVMAHLPFAWALMQTREQAGEIPNKGLWMNETESRITSLEGKAWIITFWNASNFDSVNHLVFVNDMFMTYKAWGLGAIGVHVPYYEFENDTAKIQAILSWYRMYLPVLQDPEKVWQRKWMISSTPATILVDARGQIRKKFDWPFKEDDLRREALALASEVVPPTKIPVWPAGAATPLEGQNRAWEAKFGFDDSSYLGNLVRLRDGAQMFQVPDYLVPENYYFSGTWFIENQRAVSSPASSIQILFKGASLSGVFEAVENEAVSVYVTLDEKPIPKELWGHDLKANPNGDTYLRIKEPRMYLIFSLQKPAAESHPIQLNFKDDSVYAYRLQISDNPARMSSPLLDQNEGGDDKVRLKTTLDDGR